MFANFQQEARDNRPSTYNKPHHDTMRGFWNPPPRVVKRPAQTKYVARRPCEVEALLKQADEAVNKGLLAEAQRIIDLLK